MKAKTVRSKEPRFLTNIPAENSEFIRQAAEETGFSIVTRDDAWDDRRCLLPGCISVWTNEPERDHGLFWQTYEALRPLPQRLTQEAQNV